MTEISKSLVPSNGTPKSNLFRFVTLRNPQLIEDKAKDPGFVFHPDETESPFYNAVRDLPDNEKANALKTISDTFIAYKTRTEIKQDYRALYTFSSWLMRNKNMLTYAAIQENSQSVALLGERDLFIIWDNLIYQTINKDSVYIREALIQLLVANKFLTAFSNTPPNITSTFLESQKVEFTRRAHASVVISKVLFSKTDLTKKQITPPVSKAQLRAIEIAGAEREINLLKTFNDELKALEPNFNKQIEQEAEVALTTYKNTFEEAVSRETPVIIEQKDAFGNIRNIKTYPNLVTEAFVFTPTTVLDKTYLEKELSPESLAIYSVLNLDTFNTFQAIYERIDTKIKTATETLYRNKTEVNDSIVTIGGAKLHTKQTTQPYCFSAVNQQFSSGEFGLMMQLATDYPNAHITEASFKLIYDLGGQEVIGQSIQHMDTSANTVTTFFHFNPIIMGAGIAFTFSGTFTLNNGKTYTFETSSVVDRKGSIVFNSCAVTNDNDDDTTDNPTTNSRPIYGVTNLGIADFRRVEQEVCCYVPGEVSHIENILAREYKERETRSLNSVETTLEDTREREIENLTDTTTTERNEMQSETASVLNEDQSQNYGANASVNGKFPGGASYSTGAFFNAGSSSSSSNSNSQSQTYAQEITERAMERIVQKISSKRTTRILKEFEETNVHGCDNTKGDNHVTGVYRWVDKIYKNSLINYGKRLMYEFSIPEPSKFFKEAIYKKIEDGTIIESAVITPEAPKHPSYYNIDHAGFLNEDNYQYIAAKYGAEVNAAPEFYNYTGTSFTKSEQGGDGGNDVNKAAKENVKIPKGYEAVAAKTSGYHINGIVVLTVAGLNLGLNSETFFSISPYFKDEVPVSCLFDQNWVSNINIVIRCQRTQEYYNQWKNETYNAIMEAYEERLREYNEATIADELIPEEAPEKLRFNPLTNRAIEKREIKRIAIEYLTEQKGLDISKDNYNNTNATTGVAKVNTSTGLDAHASVVKFFEQAFDWEIMAYIFYPYFYADEKDWVNLFQQQDAADPIFQSFLQSGMARAVIPVRKGFEHAVNWYMETGEVWNGQGLVIDQDDDLYLSIDEELQTTDGILEKTWETRLPTALTIVQADSAALNESGLPCACEEHKDGNTIVGSNTVLAGAESEPTVTVIEGSGEPR